MFFLKFFGRKEWYSIFLACIVFVIILGISLFSKTILWILFILSIIGLFISGYYAFFHKFKDVNDFNEMINNLKELLNNNNKND